MLTRWLIRRILIWQAAFATLRATLMWQVAFGDAMNDVEMLMASGLGVAMGNAREDVKQAAAEVR